MAAQEQARVRGERRAHGVIEIQVPDGREIRLLGDLGSELYGVAIRILAGHRVGPGFPGLQRRVPVPVPADYRS